MMGVWSTLLGTQNPDAAITFDRIPDGCYPVVFVSEEASADEFVMVALNVTAGPHKDSRLPMVFDDKRARIASRELSGDWISRMDLEGSERASALDRAMRHARSDTDGAFLVNCEDGAVTSVPEYDREAVEVLVRGLEAQLIQEEGS